MTQSCIPAGEWQISNTKYASIIVANYKFVYYYLIYMVIPLVSDPPYSKGSPLLLCLSSLVSTMLWEENLDSYMPGGISCHVYMALPLNSCRGYVQVLPRAGTEFCMENCCQKTQLPYFLMDFNLLGWLAVFFSSCLAFPSPAWWISQAPWLLCRLMGHPGSIDSFSAMQVDRLPALSCLDAHVATCLASRISRKWIQALENLGIFHFWKKWSGCFPLSLMEMFNVSFSLGKCCSPDFSFQQKKP